jgi:hypothetical protein
VGALGEAKWATLARAQGEGRKVVGSARVLGLISPFLFLSN